MYKYSSQLMQYYSETSKKGFPSVELQSKIFNRDGVFKLLDDAKSEHANVSLSTQCQSYETDFEGFCLIRSVMENGVMKKLVYLIEGDLVRDPRADLQTSVRRILIDVPQEDLSFTINLVKYDKGDFEILNKMDCVARGLAAATEVRDGNSCVVARFPGLP
jgi:hypothetical protein